jgi:hypothetical protein
METGSSEAGNDNAERKRWWQRNKDQTQSTEAKTDRQRRSAIIIAAAATAVLATLGVQEFVKSVDESRLEDKIEMAAVGVDRVEAARAGDITVLGAAGLHGIGGEGLRSSPGVVVNRTPFIGKQRYSNEGVIPPEGHILTATCVLAFEDQSRSKSGNPDSDEWYAFVTDEPYTHPDQVRATASAESIHSRLGWARVRTVDVNGDFAKARIDSLGDIFVDDGNGGEVPCSGRISAMGEDVAYTLTGQPDRRYDFTRSLGLNTEDSE